LAARHPEAFYEVRSRLETAGVRVHAAPSTREALERMREEAPDLVVLDRDLEPVTTSALVLAMRTYTPTPDIILVSEEVPSDPETFVKTLGLLQIALKPVDEAALFESILDRFKELSVSLTLPQREAPLVLCVDDDSLQLSALTRVLSQHGYRVFTCETASGALEALSEVRPDVAILDIMMPGTGGLDLLEKIRSRSGGRVPVVLLTALNSASSHQAARARGASRYLTKPCPNKELVAAVESVLAEAER